MQAGDVVELEVQVGDVGGRSGRVVEEDVHQVDEEVVAEVKLVQLPDWQAEGPGKLLDQVAAQLERTRIRGRNHR